MKLVEIHGYEPHPLDETKLCNRWIDKPARESDHPAYSFRIEGWLLFKTLRPVRIEIRLGRLVVVFAKTFVERLDVSSHFNHMPDASAIGFYCDVDTLLFPAEFEMQVVVVFEDKSEASLGIIRGKRHSPVESTNDKLQPFKIYGLARSGTTLMMRYLLHHPQIVGHDRYPYEMRMMTYFQQLMGILTSHADHEKSSHPDSYMLDIHHLGYNPYYEAGVYDSSFSQWFNESHVEEVSAFCKKSLGNFYLSLAQAQGKSDARFFAEKNLSNSRELYHWLWYPNSPAILLVRDFRDRHCSTLSFNKKRGFASFGYENDVSQEKFVHITMRDFANYLEYLKLYPNQIMIVRYEDLILKPKDTLIKIFSHGALDVSDPVINEILRVAQRDAPELKAHRTAEIGKSIGRWKKDLDPQIAALYTELMGDVMSELGYEV